MARPSKSALIDFSTSHILTMGMLERAVCPEGKAFVLLKDADKRGLRLRVTQAGGKHWQFEKRIKGKLFTRSLGAWPDVSLSEAREQAHRLIGMAAIQGDPREVERKEAEQQRADELREVARQEAQRQLERERSLLVGSVWPTYLLEGRPKRRDAFKPRYLADLQKIADPGGEKKKRGKGVTRPGPIYPLLKLPLASIDEDTLRAWHESEAKVGKHQAARALMMFRGFMRWCSAQPQYRALVDLEAGKAPAILDTLPSVSQTKRTDALETAQVPGWWSGVSELSNFTASVYLRALLLTGARREELAALTWEAVDFKWRKLTIADKIVSTRTLPLSDHLAWLLNSLPRKGLYVFASSGKTGRLVDVRTSHQKVLQSAAIDHLTFHGLRRSFALLGEAAGAPAGAIAQIMGHRPSATAEGYKPRSIDALRPYMAQIEAHILAVAGVKFEPKVVLGEPDTSA